MWSKNPTPVRALARARRRRGRASGGRRSRRWCGRSRRYARIAVHSRECAPPSTGRGARSPRRGRSRRRRRERSAAASADPDLGEAPAEVAAATARRRSARPRWSAARGWSPRCSRRTRCRAAARRTGSPRVAHARRQRLGVGADELRGARARTPRRAPGRRRGSSACTSRTSAGLGAQRASSRSSASSSAVESETATHERARRRARPGRAGRARSGSGSAPSRRRSRSGRSGRRSRRSRPRPNTWRLASWTYRFPGPTITSTGRPSRSRTRARRSPGPRPSGRRADAPASRQARQHDGIDPAVASGRRAHGDLARRRPTRAVTTPMTTVLGYGARPPGTYTAARCTGTSRSVTRVALEATPSARRPEPASATAATLLDRRAQRRRAPRVQRVPRRASSSASGTRSGGGVSAAGVEARGV